MMERCEKCGALIALVGRVHNCRPRESEVVEDVRSKKVSSSTKGKFDRLAYQRELMRRRRAERKGRAKEKRE